MALAAVAVVDRADLGEARRAGTVGARRQPEVGEDGTFTADEGSKYGGPLKLRLRLAVRAEIDRLVFVCYFEQFGDVRVPRDR